MSNKNKDNYVAVGGQALMEGIMMRGPKGTAMSLRLPDGTIETQMKDFVSVRKKYKILNLPLIRGVAAFIESMIFGYKLLMESAEKTSLDMEEESESKLDKWISDHFGPKMMAVIGTISAVLGFGLAFLLFMWLPSFVFDLVNNKLAHGSMIAWRAVFEGIIRVIIFVIYMALVARMKEIHRVYMYHGAEHKTIFCFEHGKELTVANIREEKRFHPRCGTSFIFVTIILSIVISSLVSVIFPALTASRPIWILVKLLIMPLIMGIGFEFIQLAGKYPNKFTKLLSAPGLLMQRITTAEPDDAIIEVAIEAMKAALSGKADSSDEQPEESGENAE
ncbi:MAG: DUF1385 domain-containing protein [Oscillospiraceae bacterium]|nr:DUF1385 domain-containing protein [Clostridiaceae bacterium]MDY5947850.1 DUF1385 domain-containing protein [Oscillospiraceae bacterium]